MMAAEDRRRNARGRAFARQRVAVLYTAVEAASRNEYREADDLTDNARAVARALKRLEHVVQIVPFGHDVVRLGTRLRTFRPNVIFNLAERPLDCNDHEFRAPAWLDLLGVPYTGSGAFALALCKDKGIAKRLMISHGLPTPAFRVFAAEPRRSLRLKYPQIVKPLTEDGSLGIAPRSVVANEAELRRRVRFLRRRMDQAAIAEEFLEGREFSVTLIGNGTPAAPYRAFPAGELVYHSPRWRICTFEAKWKDDHPSYAAVEARYPGDVGAPLQRTLARLSCRCAEIFQIKGYARIDFRMNARGQPLILEINPNPDLSPNSGMVRTAATAGLGYAEFLEEILRLALLEHGHA